MSVIAAAASRAKGLKYAQSKGRAIDPRFAVLAQLSDAKKRGPVVKKDKPRLLELSTGQLAMMEPDGTLRKIIPLEGCNCGVLTGGSFLLRTWQKSWVFDCATPEEATSWAEHISVFIVRANEAAEKVARLVLFAYADQPWQGPGAQGLAGVQQQVPLVRPPRGPAVRLLRAAGACSLPSLVLTFFALSVS